ncbi:barstar family protein [Rhodococcus sp. HNM0569]|uniref:barstar family protein n=1 Tax=Rhodococcus sp. HNM0569 TaxID=2716340 RepID=UPI00146C2C67|nr:barstar family protein [Rhodococcus sp. HNM0569]NLU81348.1 barstar family protein [Rhodococcus sp. HNM0569]
MDGIEKRQMLVNRVRPWLHAALQPEAEQHVDSVEAPDILTIRLRADDMTTLDGLFATYAENFSFPSYFGANWPAFQECLLDLSQCPSPKYLTVVEGAENLLIDDRDEIETYYRIVDQVGKKWSTRIGLGREFGGGEVSFNTLLAFAVPSGSAYLEARPLFGR